MSFEGKIFTSALIVGSFGTFAFAVTSITNYLVGGGYKDFIMERKMTKELKHLKNHVIICGFGRVGRQVAEDLLAIKMPFVVLELDPSNFEKDDAFASHFFVQADATQDQNLEKVNIEHAKAVITCLPKDADNVYVVLSARERKKDAVIISRAVNSNAVSKLKSAGANNVILPDAIGGSHMASLIYNPDVMEFLDILRVQGKEGSNVNSIAFNELPNEFQAKSVGQLEANKISGVTIIGFKTAQGEYIINPGNDLIMEPNSKLFVLGSTQQIERLKTTLALIIRYEDFNYGV